MFNAKFNDYFKTSLTCVLNLSYAFAVDRNLTRPSSCVSMVVKPRFILTHLLPWQPRVHKSCQLL